ncbi:DMT family transporter [Hafnia alvei]|uniref:Threonine/homoserine exporter RhtA n=1 Tax=Hafnia alvei TaxID=569 RepID=A0A1C6Z4J7_HAFAL|nr:DMT family transporter [Hafnia alvei]NLS55585.1 EamA family transporter [Hafnia alvei]SCM53978.1 Permease of the drug/metabolite transporter (DMT) superfamily [Hafnia alvei]
MPYLLLSLAACFWGGNYVVGHVLVATANPIILSAARWIFTALMLMTLYFRQVREQWPAMKKSAGTIVFLALCGQVLFPLTLYISLQYTSSLNAAIYLSTTPAMVLLINHSIFKERISSRNISGVILSSLGVIWLILQGNISHIDLFNQLNRGDIWTMGSAVSWAVYCAFLRIKPREVKGNAFVAVSAALGAVVLLHILALTVIVNGVPSIIPYVQPEFLLGLVYLIIFPSWLSYLLWNKGIATIGATRGEIFSHIIPLSGGIFSILFLHAQLHAYHAVSAIFIVAGIALCSHSGSLKMPINGSDKANN